LELFAAIKTVSNRGQVYIVDFRPFFLPPKLYPKRHDVPTI